MGPIDIAGAIEGARISRNSQPYPRVSNYMSDIGHPCERRLVYSRTHWEERIRPTATLLGIFEDGHLHEEAVIDELKRAGLKVTEQQLRFYDPETKLSGKCDGRLHDGDGNRFLFEIKAISQFSWQKIFTVEDMKKASQPWVRHWPIQFNLYLHYDKTLMGVFLLKNKASAQIKPVWVDYDEASALETIEKARRINAAVDGKTVPDRIPLSDGLCQECDFRLVCLPDMNMGEGVELVSDAALLEMLQRREELSPSVKEYAELDKLVKDAVRGRNMIVGDFQCSSKMVHKKAYSVAEQDSWQVSISRWR